MLTLALPKGRLADQVQDYFSTRGYAFKFSDRKLVSEDDSGRLKIFLVKNSDLPAYVNFCIAGLGVCGEDVLYESPYRFFELATLPFGSTRMCVAGKKGDSSWQDLGQLKIATKFPRFTQDTFHERGTAVELIKLNGSVELAVVLGLAPLIVDLVETGSTLKAHDLEVLQELAIIKVKLISNPAFFKIHHTDVKLFVDSMTK
jgi:ATP phosphoribosyltransferase